MDLLVTMVCWRAGKWIFLWVGEDGLSRVLIVIEGRPLRGPLLVVPLEGLGGPLWLLKFIGPLEILEGPHKAYGETLLEVLLDPVLE